MLAARFSCIRSAFYVSLPIIKLDILRSKYCLEKNSGDKTAEVYIDAL